MTKPCFAVLVALVATATTPVSANEGSEAGGLGEAPQLRVGFDLGIASALGFGGFSFTYAPASHFELEIGTGFGATGIQLSAMPKLVFGSPTDRLVCGVGLSAGVDVNNWSPARPHGSTALWLNVDALGYEHLFRSRWSLFAAGGIAVALAPEEYCSIDCGGELSGFRGLVLPQLRVGIGYWF